MIPSEGRLPPPPRARPQNNNSNDVELQNAGRQESSSTTQADSQAPENPMTPPGSVISPPQQQQPPSLQHEKQEEESTSINIGSPKYPKLSNGKWDYSKSLAQLANPSKTFDSDVTICFKDVSVAVKLPQNPGEVKTFISPAIDLANAITTGCASCKQNDLYRVKDLNGIIRPGETTLVLSPPGAGKSTMLRVLANRIELSSGSVTYNGRTFKEAEAEGCDLKKCTAYVDQVDTHLPLLTVYETLDFAHRLTSVDYSPQRVEDAITLLGLDEARNTIIGNALIRGVSGGQRKRVTSGELLVGDASVLFLDEFSNGLDASTAVDIMSGLRKFCLKYNSSIVATLQAPTPELFALFDRIIILREGQIVFNGPTCDVEPYFNAMGYIVPNDVDMADFLIDCLLAPRNVILRQRESDMYVTKKSGNKSQQQQTAQQQQRSNNRTFNTSYGPIQASPTPCITTEEMIEYYKTTPQWKEIKEELDEKIPNNNNNNDNQHINNKTNNLKPLMPTQKSKQMYQLGYRLPTLNLFLHVLVRQAKLTGRNIQVIIPRIVMAIIMSLLYGSLYWHVKADEYVLRLAAFVIVIGQIAFSNFIEIPVACYAQRVVKKQLAARFYPAWAYCSSILIMGVPLAIIETTIYSLFLYFMSYHVRTPLAFFTFWCILVIQSTMLGSWFRFVASIGGDEQTSQSMAGPSTGFFLIFCGLFLSRSGIPKWMLWLYYLSPFSWVARALSNNEFLASRYDQLVETPGPNGSVVFQRIGDVYLKSIDMFIGAEWILWCILFLIGATILITALNSFNYMTKFYEESIGTRRDTEDEVLETTEEQFINNNNNNTFGDDNDDNNNTNNDCDEQYLKTQITAAAIQQIETSRTGGTHGSTTGTTAFSGDGGRSRALQTLRKHVSFAPAWLSFTNIFYTVQVKNDVGETVPRILLNNVNGYAQPGKMLALMGASGAGKTTLLDVISGLKNTGVVEGRICINGQDTTPESIAALTGYVQQFHSLFPYSTVRETLEFAARCRLPATIDDQIKMKIVDEILDVLELTSISNYIIGNDAIISLSPAQCKRIDIGVELVANPSILFLDEPTTGLDSKSAQTVMTVVKRISRAGTAVVCTIHQPSAELFYLFDRLLLLGQGGYQIYFGDLGRRGQHFVQYLSKCPGVTPIKPRVNPATWMLVELGVGVQAEKGDQEEKLKNMQQQQQQQQEIVDPAFQIQDEPEWASLDPGRRTVQRFKKIYLQSIEFQNTKKRLDLLESIQIIDPNDNVAMERYKQEVQQQLQGKKNRSIQKQQQQQQQQQQEAGQNQQNQHEISITKLPSSAIQFAQPKRLSLIQQFRYLFYRNFMAYYRNPKFLYGRFIIITILCTIYGLLYLGLKPKTVSDASSLLGSAFMGTVFCAIPYSATMLPVLFEARTTFYREKASGFYNPGLFSPIAFCIELFWMFYGATIPHVILYYMVGLYNDTGVILRYFLSIYLLIACYLSMSMLFAAYAPSSQIAGIWQGTFFSLQDAVSGVAITWKTIPKGFRWLFRMLPASHLFEAMTAPQFQNLDTNIEMIQGSQVINVPIRDWYVSYTGWTYGHYWTQMGWATLFLIIVQFLAFIGTTYISHNKR